MDALYVSRVFTPPGGFTSGIEGPGCDRDGNLYAVNFEHQHTIGKVTPHGECSLFLELPEGSTGNGIRFDSRGRMMIADYTGHNILCVDMDTHLIGVHAHQSMMHQPNDIAMGGDDVIYASDPNWSTATGQVWRIDTDATVHLLEADMGTTNGIEVGVEEDRLYVNESVQRNVWAYDLIDGELHNKQLLIQFPDFGMDGMRCDVEGNLYVTRHGKGTVAKLSPKGDVLLEVELTGKMPSNIAFGGADGCTAYVMLQDEGNVEVFRVEAPGREWQMAQR